MSTQTVDDVFHALADPTRRALLEQLRSGEATIGDLAAPFDMSLPAVSKHIRVLEDAGLVGRHVQGRKHIMRLVPGQLKVAETWLHDYFLFWTKTLDSLQHYVDGHE